MAFRTPRNPLEPGLAAQADGWDPTTVTSGSTRKMWWRCEHGHRWEASINNRSKGSGCPVCAGKKVLAGVNDLATVNPELAEQADGWDPTTVTAGSNKKVSWRCDAGHRWVTAIDRRSAGTGCPVCTGRRALAGFNDLATVNAELAAQADGWDPTTVTFGSNTKVRWRCDHGHRWEATIGSRSSGNGCPVCSGKQVLIDFNDLATLNPALAAQADGWDPTTVTAGTNRKLGWRCDHGHRWEATVQSRSAGAGCPVCSGLRVLAGFNDLSTVNPELAAQADGWDPTTVAMGSSKKTSWRCGLGHTWEATPNGRSGGRGCPVCAGKKVLAGVNDLATVNPELAAQADGWDPTTVTTGSNKKLGWRCELGHCWEATVANRTNGTGCPSCAGRQVLAGFNDLATLNPELAAQADGWDPTTVTAWSDRKAWWRCAQGHRTLVRIASRSKGIGCPVCSGKQVLVGFNDLATVNPELAAQADGWDPTTVTAGSNKKLGWRCEFGHRWRVPPASRLRGEGCPSCALTGFNPNKDGWLYFIEHDGRDMLQIGITNVPEKRLEKHSRSGWVSLEVRGPMVGDLAQNLETAMLRAIRTRGGVLANTIGIERFDGWTEAWTKQSLPVTGLKQLLEWVYDDGDPSTID